MNGLMQWLSRQHGWFVGILVLAVTLPVVVVSRSGSDDGRSISQVVIVAVLIALVVVLGVRLIVMLAGVDPEAELIANRLSSEPDQRRLLARWLQRTRWSRNVGGIAGIVWWLFGTSARGDLLLYGVGGVALGSMAAQLHHVRRPSGPRTATLERRTLDDYLPAPWRRRMIAVAVTSIVMGAASLVVGGAESARWWALAAFGAPLVGYLVQRRVVERARPALATGLSRADDLARELAIGRGLAQPATYVGLALIAHGANSFAEPLGGAAVVVSVAAWIYAVYLWWQNRRLGLDWMLEQPLPAAA